MPGHRLAVLGDQGEVGRAGLAVQAGQHLGSRTAMPAPHHGVPNRRVTQVFSTLCFTSPLLLIPYFLLNTSTCNQSSSGVFREMESLNLINFLSYDQLVQKDAIIFAHLFDVCNKLQRNAIPQQIIRH